MRAVRTKNPHETGQRSGWRIDGELRMLNATDREAGSPETFASHLVLAGRARPARTKGFAMAAGRLESEGHHHREAQLLYIARGEVTCEASNAWWIVPPNSALWVPGDVHHRIRARAPLEAYNVFLDPEAARHMPAECCAVSVTPLFREIVLRLATHPLLYDPSGPGGHLVTVLLDELALLSIERHRLPMPTDPRLQSLVAMMTAKPGDGADMKTWGKRIGVAERTLNRLLVQETGLSFGRWRQQLHIILAIQGMSRGASVQAVASDLGYESASSFVTMFRKALGKSPARYMAERRADPR
jgi:AraC-like DNA-binding protein/quercetin dioxygenase-like cupin family protein